MRNINFFKKKEHSASSLFPNLKLSKNIKIDNVNTLVKSKKNDLTFFDSIKYKKEASNTKASFCLTTKKLEKLLPLKIKKIIVNNVLFELAKKTLLTIIFLFSLIMFCLN